MPTALTNAQSHATRGFSIADSRYHPRAALLDQLIDRATRIHAEERPTMREVATELAAWPTLPELPAAIDINSARARLREQIGHGLAAEDVADDRK